MNRSFVARVLNYFWDCVFDVFVSKSVILNNDIHNICHIQYRHFHIFMLVQLHMVWYHFMPKSALIIINWIIDIHALLYVLMQGLFTKRTFLPANLLSPEASKLDKIMIVSLWNLTGKPVALLRRGLSNCRAIQTVWCPNLEASRFNEILW